MKKIFAFLVIALFLFSTVAFAAPKSSGYSSGGSRSSSSSSTKSYSSPSRPSSSPSSTTSGYSPSKPAGNNSGQPGTTSGYSPSKNTSVNSSSSSTRPQTPSQPPATTNNYYSNRSYDGGGGFFTGMFLGSMMGNRPVYVNGGGYAQPGMPGYVSPYSSPMFWIWSLIEIIISLLVLWIIGYIIWKAWKMRK